MTARFRSEKYRFGTDEIVPAHIEPEPLDDASDRDPSKYVLTETAPEGGDYIPRTLTIAWDLDDVDQARQLAVARLSRLYTLHAENDFDVEVVDPNGRSTLILPPKFES